IVVWDYGGQGQSFDEQRILISDNQISRCRYGILAVHDADEKTENNSGLVIRGNHFVKIGRVGIEIPPYFNGVEIAANTFLGPLTDASGLYGIYADTNSANHIVRHNTFINLGASAVPIYLGNVTDTATFPFAVTASNNGARTEGNIVFGPQSTSFQGFSYRDIKTVG